MIEYLCFLIYSVWLTCSFHLTRGEEGLFKRINLILAQMSMHLAIFAKVGVSVSQTALAALEYVRFCEWKCDKTASKYLLNKQWRIWNWFVINFKRAFQKYSFPLKPFYILSFKPKTTNLIVCFMILCNRPGVCNLSGSLNLS